MMYRFKGVWLPRIRLTYAVVLVTGVPMISISCLADVRFLAGEVCVADQYQNLQTNR